ncbi:cytochrome c biogenesis CcdA family protein [Arsenicicoccus sp. oral taxon 190]|uniref:cytochrome c biogenesis CcdA family protein n=1 Tax=Arsenicicoccus sp. oral taxon 190 TaxID=1658671 RepID=UPI00067A0109|nr:cytochrome c biogenesis protein CcdA [Arsenicicoccus sp. oral taxon 190]AKT50456.1 thiol-disulfide oxidoreductase [Arsenicicoccus sp. oral taxon 190]
MGDVGLLGALLGGVLSLVSPCSALLLPSFFALAFEQPLVLLRRVAAFYLGLVLVLAPLGAGVGAVGSLLTVHRTTATRVGGLVVIALGVVLALGGGFELGAAQRAKGRLRLGSALSVVALGAVYGLSGFCSGPLLGSILTISLAGGSAAYGAVLMATYAAGMTLPLALLALLWDRAGLRDRRWLRGRPITVGPLRTHTTSLLTGAVFVGIGLLFLLSDGTTTLPALTDTGTQLAWQTRIQTWQAQVGDLGLLLALVVAAIVVLAVRVLRRREG